MRVRKVSVLGAAVLLLGCSMQGQADDKSMPAEKSQTEKGEADSKAPETVAESDKEKRVLERVRKVVVKQLNVRENDVTMDTTWDDLKADSLDQVELVMALEDEFGMEIPDQEAEQMIAVKQVVKYLAAHSK